MRFLSALGKSAVATIVFFVVAEIAVRAVYFARNSFVEYIPLPYVVGDEYGPIPPWLDNLLILKPDDALIWKNLPNAQRAYLDIFTPVWKDSDRVALLRRFAPWLPAEFRHHPVWRISLNEEGFRSAPIAATKRPGVVRVACIGDSWTFGMNVNQDQTYPARLEMLLRQQTPGSDVEVMNFGVLGYSSFQGLELLRGRVLDLHPDVLVIGFGMNDSDVGGYRDKDVVGSAEIHWRDRVKAMTGHSASLALMKYFALFMRFHPHPIGDFLKADAKADAGKNNDTVNYDEMEPWTRVSPRDYDRNLREMVRLARDRGARAVLLDNELWPESPYRSVLQAISRDERVPLVDSLRIIQDERARIERNLETRFRLEPALELTRRPPVRRPWFFVCSRARIPSLGNCRSSATRHRSATSHRIRCRCAMTGRKATSARAIESGATARRFRQERGSGTSIRTADRLGNGKASMSRTSANCRSLLHRTDSRCIFPSNRSGESICKQITGIPTPSATISSPARL